jgi:hypothetical protein
MELVELVRAQLNQQQVDPSIVAQGQVIEARDTEEGNQGKELSPIEIKQADFTKKDEMESDCLNNSGCGLLPNQIDDFFTPEERKTIRAKNDRW